MRIEITGVAEGKAIHAIKGLRLLKPNLSLSSAKFIIDDVREVTPYELETDEYGIAILQDHGCIVERLPPAPTSDLIEALKDFPAGIRVGDLIAVLEAMERRN